MTIRNEGPSNVSLVTSGEELITLRGLRTVTIGVTLHATGVMALHVVRLWVHDGAGTWHELASRGDATVAVRAVDTSQTPVTFVVRPRRGLGDTITQVRVKDPSGGGLASWQPADDGLSVQTELVLPAGHDAYVQAPFEVQVLGEHGRWWGKDPYIRVERVMYGDQAI